jgi:hypothetical protein
VPVKQVPVKLKQVVRFASVVSRLNSVVPILYRALGPPFGAHAENGGQRPR